MQFGVDVGKIPIPAYRAQSMINQNHNKQTDKRYFNYASDPVNNFQFPAFPSAQSLLVGLDRVTSAPGGAACFNLREGALRVHWEKMVLQRRRELWGVDNNQLRGLL
ncbi:hypothetical protein JTB14_014386 [Gonioctena quinquepunctata]|nr:hypothetical protein JTB14_014386 [Gonioctena quinquepunctata]